MGNKTKPTITNEDIQVLDRFLNDDKYLAENHQKGLGAICDFVADIEPYDCSKEDVRNLILKKRSNQLKGFDRDVLSDNVIAVLEHRSYQFVTGMVKVPNAKLSIADNVVVS